MRAVPQFVYVFRRFSEVDGPGSLPVQTDVVIIRSSAELLPSEAVAALEVMAPRPVTEYEQVDALPDVHLRLDTWLKDVEHCRPTEISADCVEVIDLHAAKV